MAHSPVVLHPAIRERIEPHISAAALAEYLILKSDEQDTILHNSRFLSGVIVAKYADARRALLEYNANPSRPKNVLEKAKKELTARADSPDLRPKAREEAKRCLETIELFQAAENALGMRALPLATAPRFKELLIEGVGVSIRPDFLVQPLAVGSVQRVGAVILRPQKAPDPNAVRIETRERRGEHRREMGRYMVAMMQMLLEQNAAQFGRFDRELSFVADLRLGERIGAAPDHAARLRAILAACKQIAGLWDSIIPRPSILRK